MRRGFKSEAERKSDQFRKELGLKQHSPLLANDLADHLKVKILNPRNLVGMTDKIYQQLVQPKKSEWSAVTVYVNGSKIILYNPRHSSARYESDIMHELAHIICCHPPNKIISTLNYGFPLGEYNVDQEEEADWLGGCLKLSRNALVWALYNNLSLNDCTVFKFNFT